MAHDRSSPRRSLSPAGDLRVLRNHRLDVAEPSAYRFEGHHSSVAASLIASSGSSGSGMFGASRDFDINGGNMMTAGGNITIFNGSPPQPEAATSSSSPMAKESSPQQASVSSAPAQHSDQRSSEIYHRNLVTKRRGSPLWIPEPPCNLAIAYQKKGVSIGDVGVLSASGCFYFFFNICYSADDPMNSGGVPEGFKPLDPPLNRFHIRKVQEYDAGSYVASKSIEISRRQYSDSPAVDLVFESSAAEGAILTMPHGAVSEDVIGTRRLRGHIAENIESWYRFIIQDCDCDAENGDVLLVTGCDKTDSWGVATFVKSTEAVQLRFQPVHSSHSYKWEYSGSFDARTGPNAGSIEALRSADDVSETEEHDVQNQCLFVRTLTATLRDDVWQKMRRSLNLEVGLDPDEISEQDVVNSHIRGSTSSQNSGLFKTNAASRQTAGYRGDLTISSNVSTQMIGHPSKLLNQFLWKKFGSEYPNARIIITKDNDWISVLRDDDREIPGPEDLYRRIMMEQESAMVEYPSDGFLTWSFSERDDSLYPSKLSFPDEDDMMLVPKISSIDDEGDSLSKDDEFTLEELPNINARNDLFSSSPYSPASMSNPKSKYKRRPQHNKLKHIDTQRFLNGFPRFRSAPVPNSDVNTEYTAAENTVPNPHPMHTIFRLQQDADFQRPRYTSRMLPEQRLTSDEHEMRYLHEYRSTPQEDFLTTYASSQEQFSEAGPSRPVAQAGLAYYGDFLQNQHADQFQTGSAQGYGHNQYTSEDLFTWPEDSGPGINYVINEEGSFDPDQHMPQRQTSAQLEGYYTLVMNPDNQDFSYINDSSFYGSQ